MENKIAIESVKEKLLKKIDKEIGWIDSNTSSTVDQQLSVTIKNLSEVYKNLCEIKEEK